MHDTINKNVFSNYFINRKSIELGSIAALSLNRKFSSRIPLSNSPESIALEHINSGKPITSSIINQILLNQNIFVTDLKLKELLKVKGVEIDLPITLPENNKLLDQLTGKSSYKGFFGVYIFIHKSTGQKYVGSSNLLRRRINYYLKGDYPLSGKFLPLLHKEGLKSFKLIIFKLNNNKFSSQDALILEQYFLLNKEMNLNTLRVVNAGSSKGEAIYIYDLTCSTLYFQAKSKIELKRVLKIHPETCNKFLDSKKPYLNKFFLLSFYIPTALISNISKLELAYIIQKERQELNKLKARRIPVELEIKEGNTFVDSVGKTLKFDSLTSCNLYLRDLGLTIKRDTLAKYLKNKKVFHNFLCKYLQNELPENFEEIGLIIDEYKKSKLKMNFLEEVNKKNKPVLVKGENFEKEFESITDTVKYFKNINIILDRKTLNNRLNDGKIYKKFFFRYK